MTATILKTDNVNTIELDSNTKLVLSADMSVRITISDEMGYGTCLPATVAGDKLITFMLPEVLAPFMPDVTYVCRVELVSDDQLSTETVHICAVTVGRDEKPDEAPTPEPTYEDDPAIALIDRVIMQDGTQRNTKHISTELGVSTAVVSIDDLVREIDGLFVGVRQHR